MVKNSKEYQKAYYEKYNVACDCECGGKYKKYFKKSHENTLLHQNYIKEKEKPFIDKKKKVVDYVRSLQQRIKYLEEMAQENKTQSKSIIESDSEIDEDIKPKKKIKSITN
jgi:hypothetical protein